jgi:hypothetical protein
VHMDSSCELLSSLQQARHSCEVHCRTEARTEGCRIRLVLLGVRLPGGVCLTEITREPHRWVWLYWEAPRALLGLPPALLTRRRVDLNRVSNTTGAALTHPHPQKQQVHSKLSLRRAVDAV